MIAVAFEAKARAAEREREHVLWAARETALLNAYAYHKPQKMPSLDKLLGREERAQSGEQRRALMKAFAAKRGKVVKRGRA